MHALLGTALAAASIALSAPAVAVSAPASVTAAVTAAEQAGNRVAVAVLDTDTGAFYGTGDVDGQFPSESVVKVLIAANLLANGEMTGSTEQVAFQMITQSDDDAADALWGTVGGPAVIAWAQSYFHVSGFAAPSQWGWWGNTKVTARALVELYAAIKANPVVGPWLLSAMAQMSPTAADGYDQEFGLAEQTASGAFKQGWGDDDDAESTADLLSTGLLDGNRYAVAVLAQHAPAESLATLTPVIDAVAAAVAPHGQVTVPATPRPAPTRTPTPTPTPTPTRTPSASPSPTAAAPAAAAPRTPTAAHRSLPQPLQAAMAGSSVSLAAYVLCLIGLWLSNRRRRRISARTRGGRAGPVE